MVRSTTEFELRAILSLDHSKAEGGNPRRQDGALRKNETNNLPLLSDARKGSSQFILIATCPDGISRIASADLNSEGTALDNLLHLQSNDNCPQPHKV
jgi:hypothetical protein